MRTTHRSTGLRAALLAMALLTVGFVGAEAAPRVSGPYVHHNLALYLVHGPDGGRGDILTLDAALSAGLVVVHETGNVNELAVENVSPDRTVFLQAGDIVKGGKQDRALSQDMVLRPRSGKVPIAAFCVERGRWRPREGEAADSFASSKHTLSSKELKLAARRARSQQQVWNEVAALQEKLAAATGAPVASPESATSLQLSLENEQLAQTRKAYVEALVDLVESHGDAAGLAVAVNGAVSSAEVYASPGLFRSSWKRLLDAAATEAIAGLRDSAAPSAPSAEDVARFLAVAEAGTELTDDRPSPERSEARQSDAAVFFESRLAEERASWVHRSYIAR